MKSLPNALSALRFLGAVCLLFFGVESCAFWAIYFVCGLSDMADGYLARKLGCESKVGAMLDSLADLVFVVCCCFKLIPAFAFPRWLWIWGGVIVAIKVINQISALVMYKKCVFPHTMANKMTGGLLFLSVPTAFWTFIPIVIVAGVATFAAIIEGHYIRTEKGH